MWTVRTTAIVFLLLLVFQVVIPIEGVYVYAEGENDIPAAVPEAAALPDDMPPADNMPVNPDEIVLSSDTLAIHPAQEVGLGVSGVVSGGSVDIVMTSSDENVVTVTPSGVVRGENSGSAEITVVVTENGNPIREMTCPVSVTTQSASYAKLKKKVYNQRGKSVFFNNYNNNKSGLTYFGFYYHSFKVHPGDYTYGSGDETIMLYPVIVASKDGSGSKLRLGIDFSSFVEIKNRVSRNYKKMKFSGGGESFTISGTTTCKHQTIGSYIRWQIRTTGTFYLSSDANTQLVRLDMLERILSANKPKIIVKDSVTGRKYRCVIASDRAKGLIKMIKKYKKCLRAYW